MQYQRILSFSTKVSSAVLSAVFVFANVQTNAPVNVLVNVSVKALTNAIANVFVSILAIRLLLWFFVANARTVYITAARLATMRLATTRIATKPVVSYAVIRIRPLLLLLLFVGPLASAPALAQSSSTGSTNPSPSPQLPEPVDPLKRPEHTPGRFSFNFYFGYSPSSGAYLDYDEEGNPYTDSYTSHALSPSFSARYAISEQLTVGAGLTISYTVTQTLRSYYEGDTVNTRYIDEGDLSFLPRLSLAYRPEPDSLYDPSLSFTLYKPWALGVSLSASLLRDPVVLSSSLSLSHSFMPPYSSNLSLAAGAGFVVNDRISFSLNASLDQPLGFAASPGLSLTFSTGYGLDPEGNSQLSLDLSASFKDGSASYSLGLGYGVREVEVKAADVDEQENTEENTN